MAGAASLSIRGVSRAITVSSSSPIVVTAGNNCCIAQGRSLNKCMVQQSSPSSFFTSSSTLIFRQPRQLYSTLSILTSKKKPFSSKPTSKQFTTVELFDQKKNQEFSKSRMASAGVVVPDKSYSSVLLKPQIDALDENVDPVQRELLEEQCIVLNDKDQVIGHDTKRNCHRIVNGDVLLHRAFSVFLFNGKGELLLQQRSKTKITFPYLWTNTCCSHPLYTPSELEEKESMGVKRAARRRLEIELGIPQSSIGLNDFQYLTRIHYKALSNSIWGEHEIDYILFLQKDNLEINPNPDEIQDIRWVTLEDVKDMVAKENVGLTPWFELIMNSRLPDWWNNLKSLKQFEDHGKIHRLT